MSLLVRRQSVNHIQQLPQSCASSYLPISVGCNCQIVCMPRIASRKCQHNIWVLSNLYLLLLFSVATPNSCSPLLFKNPVIYGYSKTMLPMATPKSCSLLLFKNLVINGYSQTLLSMGALKPCYPCGYSQTLLSTWLFRTHIIYS